MGAPVRAVVFDLDGTLIDSLPAIRLAFGAVCVALDLPVPDRAAAQSFVGAGVPVAMERLLAWAGADRALKGRAVALMLEAYDAVPVTENRVLDGAHDLLAALADAGVATGLCTNKPRTPTSAVLHGLALGPFGAVVCGDDLARRKPDPEPLFETIRRLNASPERTAYVGDSEIDHATAAAAGVRFAFLRGGYLNAPLDDPPPAWSADALSDLHILARG